jgi:hypothetical protein
MAVATAAGEIYFVPFNVRLNFLFNFVLIPTEKMCTVTFFSIEKINLMFNKIRWHEKIDLRHNSSKMAFK